MVSTIKQTILAASIALISFNAHATLTSYNANGVDLVYSSVSDVTWTKDGNLLGSMMATDPNLVSKIIAASLISTYPIKTEDFSVNEFGQPNEPGQTNWFGAMAFINYLNTINYGGSNQWRLPTVTGLGPSGCNYSYNGTNCGFNVATNGTIIGNEMAELYYGELGSRSLYNTAGQPQLSFGIVDKNNHFVNEHADNYWSGSQYTEVGMESSAMAFDAGRGEQDSYGMGFPFYVWAVTSGQATSVPEPENLAMLLAGLGLLGVAVRRNK